MKVIYACLVCLCSLSFGTAQTVNTNRFPDGFMFGVSTAAYQIEGAWNVSGKGENVWDRFTHEHPERIFDRSNGDVACDSYHKFQEDIAAMKTLGVEFYRFSLSWSRILPKGFAYKINPDGIRYYNELLDALLENNITPMVTMFHWDTPQRLQDLGGFANDLMPDWFEQYSDVIFTNFGDKVKLWLTFNEPGSLCQDAYGHLDHAPGLNSSGIGDYLCGHNLLKAHARAYHLYDKKYRRKQKGKVGISLATPWYIPKTDSQEDKEAAERALAFEIGWFADPIFGSGNYPKVMRDRIEIRSWQEGFTSSRLPRFSLSEEWDIKGTYDFMGINHYVSMLAENVPEAPFGEPSYENDLRVATSYDPTWPGTSMKIVPWGFTEVLKWIKKTYGKNVDIYVTENGYGGGSLDDTDRIDYLEKFLSALLDAVYNNNVRVKAYAVWSLMDNFEWTYGYLAKFGLYHVDFLDPERGRTPKPSANYYGNVVRNRRLV